MELSTAALLAASGLAAVLVNAIAGGGTLFTFSALVAAGLPPGVANATSAVAVTPTNLSSAWAYRRELAANARRFAALGIVSLIGGLGGAYILTVTNNDAFRQLVPWLLLFATLLFAASPEAASSAAVDNSMIDQSGESREGGFGCRHSMAPPPWPIRPLSRQICKNRPAGPAFSLLQAQAVEICL